MTTSVQRRRGSTVQHSTFTGLEGEVTIDTSKDTAVVHDGSTVGGFPLAKEGLENTNTVNLTPMVGTDTAVDDTFLIYDASAGVMKKITRAELNNAIEVDALANVTITGGSINGTTIGASTASSGAFTTLSASSTATLNTLASSGATITGGSINNTPIGASTANTGAFTNLSYTGTLTGGTGVVNIGSGQFYKDASGNVGIGTSSPNGKLAVSENGANGFEVITAFSSGTETRLNSYNRSSSAYTNLSADALIHYWLTSGTERMRIDASGNVGIGTSSFTNKFNAYSSTGNVFAKVYNDLGAGFYGVDSSGAAYCWNQGNQPLYFGTNDTERMRISSTGGIRVGSSANPSAGSAILSLVGAPSGGASCTQQFTYNGGTYGGSLIGSGSQGGGMEFYTFTGNVGSESYTERMRIDSSGNLLVGGSSRFSGIVDAKNTSADVYGANLSGSGGSVLAANISNTNQYYAYWMYNGPNIGTISTNGTSVSYNTTSDYRLKENIAPMTGALDTVAQLKPVTYNWKADGSAGQGFIAHELQAVVPDCVTGEKDAVDKEGKPVYQGIDVSFLVATLTKAIQEQQALITQLQADVALLKGN